MRRHDVKPRLAEVLGRTAAVDVPKVAEDHPGQAEEAAVRHRPDHDAVHLDLGLGIALLAIRLDDFAGVSVELVVVRATHDRLSNRQLAWQAAAVSPGQKQA